MPLDYNPKDASTCWPEAEYDATLKTVVDGVSKTSGQPMQTLTYEVYHDDGRKQLISDYITAAGIFKLKQLAVALGRKTDFEAGTFQADDHLGAGVRVKLTIEAQDGYDDKNRIGKILPPDAAPAPVARQPQQRQSAAPSQKYAASIGMRPQREPLPSPVSEDQQFKDDDIPF